MSRINWVLTLRISPLVGAALALLASQAAPAASTPEDAQVQQWEYLVVSAGLKTRFSSVAENPLHAKAVVVSGIAFGGEAISIEQRMDGLGTLGWELVAVVGMIGGDQQFVFKRPYMKSIVEAEAALRRKQAEELASLLMKLKQEPAPGAGPQIIDLDEKERLELLSRNIAQLENSVNAALDDLKGRGLKIVRNELKVLPRGHFVFEEATLGGSWVIEEATLGGSLVIDGTTQLLSPEKTYRSSEARRLAKEICANIVRLALTSQYDSLPEPVAVEITIQGKSVAKQRGSSFIDGKLF